MVSYQQQIRLPLWRLPQIVTKKIGETDSKKGRGLCGGNMGGDEGHEYSLNEQTCDYMVDYYSRIFDLRYFGEDTKNLILKMTMGGDWDLFIWCIDRSVYAPNATFAMPDAHSCIVYLDSSFDNYHWCTMAFGHYINKKMHRNMSKLSNKIVVFCFEIVVGSGSLELFVSIIDLVIKFFPICGVQHGVILVH